MRTLAHQAHAFPGGEPGFGNSIITTPNKTEPMELTDALPNTIKYVDNLWSLFVLCVIGMFALAFRHGKSFFEPLCRAISRRLAKPRANVTNILFTRIRSLEERDVVCQRSLTDLRIRDAQREAELNNIKRDKEVLEERLDTFERIIVKLHNTKGNP